MLIKGCCLNTHKGLLAKCILQNQHSVVFVIKILILGNGSQFFSTSLCVCPIYASLTEGQWNINTENFLFNFFPFKPFFWFSGRIWTLISYTISFFLYIEQIYFFIKIYQIFLFNNKSCLVLQKDKCNINRCHRCFAIIIRTS